MRKPRAPARGTFLRALMSRQRVVCFIDGFNLYHAIYALHRPELNWTDLRALSTIFLKRNSETLSHVFYFSAYADHISESSQKCQRAYVLALELTGVKPILGNFKKKNRKCPSCGHQWFGHEEKETDVNIALALLNLAYQNNYDRALVISNDSDLVPAIKISFSISTNRIYATGYGKC